MTIHATPGHPPLRAGDQTQTAAELQEIWDADPRWDGIERTYTADDVVAPARLGARGAHARRSAAPRTCGILLNTEDYVRRARRLTGNQAVQQVRAGLKAIYLSRLAGRGRRATSPARPTPTRASTPPTRCRPSCAASTTRCCAPDQIEHAEGTRSTHRLAGADRRRRRGRLRRTAQRLRAHAVDDRGRRRRRALGGPAREREEVRPHGRQGARADAAAHPHAQRRAAGRRRRGRADGDHRPHRRARRRPAHQRRRRARPAVHHRRAHRRGLLPGAERPRAGHRPRPRLRAVRRPALGRDRRARPRPRPRVRRGRCTRSSRASCWPTTARRRSTGSATSTTTQIATFQHELARLGYKFQFITLAGFHALNHSMFDARQGLRRARA